MKKKFSKILGVGLTLALLTSLLLTAAPVSAVTTPVVTLTATVPADAYVISKDNTYTILFTTGVAVPAGGDVVVGFMAGTNITGMVAGDIEIDATEGIDGIAVKDATPSAIAITGTYPAAMTLTITVPAIGAGAIVQLTIDNVTNPDTAGNYTLTVATQDDDTPPVVIEAAVTSLPYTIKVPTIAGLPGVASVYNPTGILMAQDNDLQDAIDAAGPDYTIYVGPGTYTLSSERLTIAHEGLMFVSTDGAATTIIDATASLHPAIHITADDVTFDGFTLDDFPQDGIWILQGADDVTIQNNVFIDGGPGAGIVLQAATGGGVVVTGAAILDNVFEDNFTAIVILGGATDNTISGNTITGCTDTDTSITLEGGSAASPLATEGNTITGNTITDNAGRGIHLYEGLGDYFEDNVIEGNTISENALAGIEISSDLTGTAVTGLEILNNVITDNEGDGILIAFDGAWDPSNAIKFNTITGNDTSTTDYGIESATNNDVDAALNWWGTTVAADIAAMVSAATTKAVTTAPFLAGTADTVFSATAAGTGLTLDGKTAVGVKVSVANANTDTDKAPTIAVAKYIANPEEAIADAIAFYDVYVAGAVMADTTEPAATIKFYAGDANTEVYIWSADTETWGEVAPVSYSAYGGYVYVTVDTDMLGGTPFALVAGAAAGLDTPPELLVPEVGAEDIRLTPTFGWGAVTDADNYVFELADNPLFVDPLVKLAGYPALYYTYTKDLHYSTAYYWRVRARSATLASDWGSGVFITMDEPVEPTPPVVVEEAPPAPIITVEQPDIVVTPPAVTPITPAWIYAIIGVGAVLVIALLVLIVRTRRVA